MMGGPANEIPIPDGYFTAAQAPWVHEFISRTTHDPIKFLRRVRACAGGARATCFCVETNYYYAWSLSCSHCRPRICGTLVQPSGRWTLLNDWYLQRHPRTVGNLCAGHWILPMRLGCWDCTRTCWRVCAFPWVFGAHTTRFLFADVFVHRARGLILARFAQLQLMIGHNVMRHVTLKAPPEYLGPPVTFVEMNHLQRHQSILDHEVLFIADYRFEAEAEAACKVYKDSLRTVWLAGGRV